MTQDVGKIEQLPARDLGCGIGPSRVRARAARESPRVGQGQLAHDERCSTMAWEPRGTHTYYYRSVRRHGHVTKDYLGTGPLAERYAAEDAERRAQRYTEAETWRQEQAAFDALDQQIDAWWDMSTCLLYTSDAADE